MAVAKAVHGHDPEVVTILPMPFLASHACWICNSSRLRLVKPSNLTRELSSECFSITDSHYGVTAAIYRCEDCGFMECPQMPPVLPFYEDVIDESYEVNRRERSLQQRKILELVRRYKRGGRLLDIGAGSGMLVQEALKMGYDAHGVEPSASLQSVAQRLGLPVLRGAFPAQGLTPPYDLITLVDILEHVSNPMEILVKTREALSEDGVSLIITPDAGSLMARLLGFRWWHFRTAHIGYFNSESLMFALDKAGFRPLLVKRPTWYFSADYLAARLNRYLPGFSQLPIPNLLKKRIVPLNPFDSLMVVCKSKT
jgi:hypothetical protein